MSTTSYKQSLEIFHTQDKIINSLIELRGSLKLFQNSINDVSDFSIMINKAEELISSCSNNKIGKLSGSVITNEKNLTLYKKLECYLLNKKRIRFEIIKMNHQKQKEKEEKCLPAVDKDLKYKLKNNKQYLFKTFTSVNTRTLSNQKN